MRAIKSNQADVKTTYLAKLKSSDLTAKDASRLSFQVIDNPQALEPHFFKIPAFKIPYLDPKGKATGFYRIRYLASTNTGFKAVTKAKARRYDQPAAELPQLYLPDLIPNDNSWRDVFNNPELPICVTEGELKAACATKHGIPTLALGGVWNFKAKKSGLFRLPIFEDINLKGRKVYIIFDSDAATNPQVLFAQYKFAEELFNCGAEPLVVNMPPHADPERKYGIDDYIVERGIAEYKALITDENNVKEFAFVKELMRLNGEIAVVMNPAIIVQTNTGQMLKRADAMMLYANRRMIEKKIVPAKKADQDDTIKYAEVGAFDKWLQWEQRAEVLGIAYEPGAPKFVEVEDGRKFNTWDGWGAEPIEGDVSLWEWLLECVFKNAEPSFVKWFIQWCAYPLQNPGVKMYSCPVLFGQVRGTGKSLIGFTLGAIYGNNFKEITNKELEDERNVYAAKKQFIMGSEVVGSEDKRGQADRLRNLITQHSITVNEKYVPDYTIRDTINYFFTSQHVDALYIEKEERRYGVHETLGPPIIEVSHANVLAYDAWLKSGEAASAVFYHLLQVDLTGFDPMGPAPETESKAVMAQASRTEIEEWCFKLREDPDTCLRHGNTIVKFALYRIKDLVAFYQPDGFGRTYEKTMSKALRKAGFVKAAHGESCPTKDGKINLWIIRDTEKYESMSQRETGAAYDAERDFTKSNKKFAAKEKTK